MSVQKLLPRLFLNQPAARDYVPRRAEASSIPRIIHQTYRSWDAIPAAIRDSIAELRARNAGWEYRFYDDAAASQFIRDAYGSTTLARFERINPRYGAARADVFRYLLAYHTGGVYLDIKSTARRPLDEILLPDDRLILAQWPEDGTFDGWGSHDWDFAGRIEGGEFQQWHVICAPGHPYMHAVINAVLRNIDCYVPQVHGCGVNAVLRLTGPIAYTIAMLPLLPAGLHRTAQPHKDLGLDYSTLPTNTDHKRVLASHYSKLSEPVVHPDLVQKVLGRLYTLYDGLRKRPLSRRLDASG